MEEARKMERKNASRRDLEQRLIDYAIMVVKLTELMPSSAAGKYHASQLLRSGGATALSYGGSQGGETHRDFTRKIKLVLKELKDPSICLRIIKGAGLSSQLDLPESTLSETKELVAIFTASVKTADLKSGRR